MADIPIPGMVGTGEFSDTMRPESWTQGMLELDPNGDVILTYLLSVLKKEKASDPKHHWHERLNPSLTADVTGIYINPTLSTAYTFSSHGATIGKVGQTLYLKMSETNVKQFRVGHQVLLRDDSDPDVDKNSIVQQRVINGASSYIAVKLLEDDAETDGSNSLEDVDIAANAGSAQGEGSASPEAIEYQPTEYENYTQIFEESIDLTRTALKTRLRTGDPYLDAKRMALNNILKMIERAFIHGARYSDTDENGKIRTFTGGVRWFLKNYAPNNISNFTYDTDIVSAGSSWTAAGEDWLDYNLEKIFRYGSNEKIGLCGPGVLLGLKALAKAGGTYEINAKTMAYGLKIVEFFTPFGTVYFKKHPQFIYDNVMRNSAIILDTKYLGEFYIDDIFHKKDPKGYKKGGESSKDGVKESFLCEKGLQLRNAQAHGILTGFNTKNLQ
jgi:hypothetical protein